MRASIIALENALKVAETNEPINRAEGNTAQADLEALDAAEHRQALVILRAAFSGPIWPEPKGPEPVSGPSLGEEG